LRTLFEPIQGFLKLQAMALGKLHSDPFRDLDEEVLVRYAIKESTLDIHLLDVKVVECC
jgi:hypothetical protein